MYVPGISKKNTLKSTSNGCNRRKGDIIAENNNPEKYLDLECVAKQHQTPCELNIHLEVSAADHCLEA